MKKLLLSIALGVFSLGAFAQFQFGIKTGLNLSKLSSGYIMPDKVDRDAVKKSFDDNGAYKSGFNIAFAMCTGGKIFSFQPEFAIAQRGIKYKNSNFYERMNYFDIKPLFNIGGGSDSWRVYSQFGFSFNTWLTKKGYDSNGNAISGTENWDEDDVRFDIGLILGFGFKYKLGPGWILANPRYEWGLLPTHVFKNTDDEWLYGTLNKTFNFNIGYLFSF